jgi:hypothetical protein
LTPERNQELTAKLAKFHAAFLDRIGSLYFTKENYDDFYYGKGSTYPDINGAIGILFEQASSRGHLQQTANGLLSFPFTIKNQFIATLSTLEGAKALRKEFLQWQRDFYKNAIAEAAAAPVKAYIFGDNNDEAKTGMFVDMLRRHQIDVYAISKNINAEGYDHKKGTSFIVPANQNQFKVIKAIFDKTLDYKDSLFYDITAWTMPLAFGLPYAELKLPQFTTDMIGEKVRGSLTGAKVVFEKSSIGYLLDWTNFYAPAVLYELQNAGIIAKVSTNPFELTVNNTVEKFSYGTIMIPFAMQTKSGDQLYETLQKTVSGKYGVKVFSVTSGNAVAGSDLGSSKFIPVTKPLIAMIVGTGVNATDAGEVWHLLDQRMNIPATHLEIPVFNRVDLNKYNTIIMVGGTYPDMNKDKLKAWVQNGGTLIVTEEAVTWAAQNGISDVKFKKAKSPVDSIQRLAYTEREQIDGAQMIYGAIFGADVDLTNPLAYGYDQKTVSLFKANKVFMEKSKNPFATPYYYGNNPLQSGWISRENKEVIKNSAAVIVNTVGNGRVINIADNPNFRAFWLGGTKLFMNAIFFGRIIDAASGRTEE